MKPSVTTCPHVDRGDARCACRLTLHNLSESFDYCFGQPLACRVYHLICLEDRRRNIHVPVARTA